MNTDLLLLRSWLASKPTSQSARYYGHSASELDAYRRRMSSATQPRQMTTWGARSR